MFRICTIIFLSIALMCFLSQRMFAQDVWVAPAWTDTLKNTVAFSTKGVNDAKKIYENVCWTCHGLTGQGNGPASLTMKPLPADHTSARVQGQTDGALFWKISKGKGNMQPYESLLTRKQRWELVYYIRQLGKTETGLK